MLCTYILAGEMREGGEGEKEVAEASRDAQRHYGVNQRRICDGHIVRPTYAQARKSNMLRRNGKRILYRRSFKLAQKLVRCVQFQLKLLNIRCGTL